MAKVLDPFGFLGAIGGKYSGPLVTAVFKNGNSADFPRRALPMLLADSGVEYVYDSETGEVLGV